MTPAQVEVDEWKRSTRILMTAVMFLTLAFSPCALTGQACPASIDRLNNELCYKMGNVIACVLWLNMAKGGFLNWRLYLTTIRPVCTRAPTCILRRLRAAGRSIKKSFRTLSNCQLIRSPRSCGAPHLCPPLATRQCRREVYR
jgi:hypothetical protein